MKNLVVNLFKSRPSHTSWNRQKVVKKWSRLVLR